MITHPTAGELTEALAAFDGASGGDGRATFLARVADNARATLEREAALGPAAEVAVTRRLRALLGMEGDFAGLNTELCARLRDGRLSPLDP